LTVLAELSGVVDFSVPRLGREVGTPPHADRMQRRVCLALAPAKGQSIAWRNVGGD
jgi:hypothetical protein